MCEKNSPLQRCVDVGLSDKKFSKLFETRNKIRQNVSFQRSGDGRVDNTATNVRTYVLVIPSEFRNND